MNDWIAINHILFFSIATVQVIWFLNKLNDE